MTLGRLWAKNIFDNIAAVPGLVASGGVAPLPRFPGVTAVCGAGPSLEIALPFLAANRSLVSIVACDTSLGTLLSANVVPDLVVCLEAQAYNLADFTPLGKRPVQLAADFSSHPATLRSVLGLKHLTLVHITNSRFLDRVAGFASSAGLPVFTMPPLGSVGVHAARIARELSAGPVLAFGLDFSFEVGKTHARGSPSISAEERRIRRLDRWPAQYAATFRRRASPAPCAPLPGGRALVSDPLLLAYAGLLSEVVAMPGPPLYDARGRGPSFGAIRIDLAAAARLVREFRPTTKGPTASATARGSDGLRRAQPPSSKSAWPETVSRATMDFLKSESEILDAMYDAMKGRPRTTGALSGVGLAQLVAMADYLHWSFPDADRASGLPQDFLNRLLPEVEWWSFRLSRIMEGLS